MVCGDSADGIGTAWSAAVLPSGTANVVLSWDGSLSPGSSSSRMSAMRLTCCTPLAVPNSAAARSATAPALDAIHAAFGFPGNMLAMNCGYLSPPPIRGDSGLKRFLYDTSFPLVAANGAAFLSISYSSSR